MDALSFISHGDDSFVLVGQKRIALSLLESSDCLSSVNIYDVLLNKKPVISKKTLDVVYGPYKGIRSSSIITFYLEGVADSYSVSEDTFLINSSGGAFHIAKGYALDVAVYDGTVFTYRKVKSASKSYSKPVTVVIRALYEDGYFLGNQSSNVTVICFRK